jgi:hypothetical protein
MKLLETVVTETAVGMRYADNADPAKAKHWIDCQVPLSELKKPSGMPLGDPERHYLVTVREVGLRYVRDVFEAEIARLADLRSQGPR